MINSWKQLSEVHKSTDKIKELEACQTKWLLDCLKRNSTTAYGKRFQFNKIETISDFQRLVPVISYDDISGSITAIASGKTNDLFAGDAIAFERTSGSTSNQKLIPYSRESIHDFRIAILPWLSSLVRKYGITSGKAYWAISPATRQPEVTASGIPVGLPDAAYLGEDLIPFFLESSVVPQWVAEMEDVDDWQLVTLYYLVCCRDLKLISVWSPTFFLLLIDALDARRDELESVLRNGGEKHNHALPENNAALDSLEKYYALRDLRVLWPELKVISCWTEASAAYYAERLQSLFPEVPIQSKGLLLTEGVVTVPNQDNQTVLTADSGFYEFSGADDKIKLAHELSAGERYEVIITTSGGLYRYETHDRVLCAGFALGLPILHFIGRARTSDLVGEKLSEEFVTSCLEDVNGFRMLLPRHKGKPGYTLVVEDGLGSDAVVSEVESRLMQNPHYAYARKIGQLQSLAMMALKDPLAIYIKSALDTGTRLGDIKVPSLCFKPSLFEIDQDKVA